RQLDELYVGDGDAQRDPVDLSLYLRDDETGRLGGPGRRRDDAQGGGPGASQVLVRQVEDLLVVRVAVDGRHEPVLEAPAVQDHLHHGDQTVGRARRVGEHGVLGRRVLPVVRAHNARDTLRLRGGGAQ